MGSKTEEEIKNALQGVLDLYGIQLEGEKSQETSEQGGVFSKILGKTQAKLDELNIKAEEIYEQTGMSREEIENYASNPNNFTPKEWEALQRVKEACDQYAREAVTIIDDPTFVQKVENQEKKKQTHRFGKKKNWVPL